MDKMLLLLLNSTTAAKRSPRVLLHRVQKTRNGESRVSEQGYVAVRVGIKVHQE